MASVTQTGPTSWRCLVRKKGHKTICQTFKTRKEAEAFGVAAERDMDAGRPAPKGGVTVAVAIDAFRRLRAAKRPIKPGSSEDHMLRNIERGIGKVSIAALTPEKLAGYCQSRTITAGPYTIGMELSKLGTVLKYAGISLRMVFPDVVAQARPLLEYSGYLGPGKERERRPTADELVRVLSHLEPVMQDIVQFAIASAMRRGEICRIRWADVDAKRHLVTIRDRKHPRRKEGNDHVVPMVDATGYDAWAILNRQPKGDRIFPVSPEYVSDSFLHACRVAKVEGLHFHDLRHECTSRLFEAGWSIEQVAMVTGHADWRALKRYTNLRPESLTSAPRPSSPPSPGSRNTSRRRRKTEP